MESKSEKKIARALASYSKVFLPQEKIYACSNTVYFTGLRILQLGIAGKVKNEIQLEDVINFSTTRKKFATAGPLLVETINGNSIDFGLLTDKEYEEFQRILTIIRSGGIPEYVEAPTQQDNVEAPTQQKGVEPVGDKFFEGTELIFDAGTTKKFGFSPTLQKNIISNSPKGIPPWLVVTSGANGALAAYDTELVILKIGALTGLMASATGGGRITHFPYRQITTIEYNSGFLNGVLEILTASYSGEGNKDFWSIGRTNKGKTDPRQQNNTLPLSKITFNQITPQLNKIREMIEKIHSGNSSGNTGSMSDEIEKLSDLHKRGILTEEEFKEAKKKLFG
jgi:hypothetical protein